MSSDYLAKLEKFYLDKDRAAYQDRERQREAIAIHNAETLRIHKEAWHQTQAQAFRTSVAQLQDADRQAQEFGIQSQEFLIESGQRTQSQVTRYSASGAMVAGSAMARMDMTRSLGAEGAQRLQERADIALMRGTLAARATRMGAIEPAYVAQVLPESLQDPDSPEAAAAREDALSGVRDLIGGLTGGGGGGGGGGYGGGGGGDPGLESQITQAQENPLLSTLETSIANRVREGQSVSRRDVLDDQGNAAIPNWNLLGTQQTQATQRGGIFITQEQAAQVGIDAPGGMVADEFDFAAAGDEYGTRMQHGWDHDPSKTTGQYKIGSSGSTTAKLQSGSFLTKSFAQKSQAEREAEITAARAANAAQFASKSNTTASKMTPKKVTRQTGKFGYGTQRSARSSYSDASGFDPMAGFPL